MPSLLSLGAAAVIVGGIVVDLPKYPVNNNVIPSDLSQLPFGSRSGALVSESIQSLAAGLVFEQRKGAVGKVTRKQSNALIDQNENDSKVRRSTKSALRKARASWLINLASDSLTNVTPITLAAA